MAICVRNLFTILFALSSAHVMADDWPKFRGPSGNGHAPADSKPPISWSKDKNVRWSTALSGEGWSSPVIAGDRIYLSAATEGDSEQYDLALLIFDLKTGKKLKQVSLMPQKGRTRIHKKNSHASPTPIIDGQRLFVHFGYQGTVCTDLEGEKIWENRELFFKPTHGNGGSPVLVNGKLIFTCDGDKNPKIVALNAETGKVAWQTPRPLKAKKTFSFCTPVVIEAAGKTQVIAPGSDCVLALEPESGNVIWDVRYTGYSVVPKPIFESGKVFVSTSFDNAKLLAIRPDGKGIVTDSHVDWIVDRNISKTPSMIGHEGLIYSVSDNGIAVCTDSETGDTVYKQRLGGNFSASPILASGNVYFTSEEGVTTVVSTGREFNAIAENDMQERTLASLAVVGNAIIMRTDKALYRIEQ